MSRSLPARSFSPPRRYYAFQVVDLAGQASIDYVDAGQDFRPHHVAFLVSEAEFDAVLQRLREGGIEHWADPFHSRPGEINHQHGGRGVYFDDPDGHQLECITAPYA